MATTALDGRFHLLPGTNTGDPPVHARLQKDGIFQALIGARAFAAPLTPSTAFADGLSGSPTPDLLALLLAAPASSARLTPADGSHLLEISCWDAAGVQLRVFIVAEPVDAGPLVTACFDGFIAALAGMEAVLDEFESERASGGRTPPARAHGADGVVGRLARQTLVRGRPIAEHPAFKRAALADARGKGSRAHAQARVAMEVREAAERRRARARRMRGGKAAGKTGVTGGAKGMLFADEGVEDGEAAKVATAKKEPDLAETPRNPKTPRGSQESAVASRDEQKGRAPVSRSTDEAELLQGSFQMQQPEQSTTAALEMQAKKDVPASLPSQEEQKTKPRRKKKKRQRLV